MSQIYEAELPYSDELAHHGIPGQKWGVRRFQNADGSLTAAGRERYSKSPHRLVGENGKGDKIVDARVRKATSKKASVLKSGNKKSGKDFVKGVASATLHGAARAASRLGEGVARGVKSKLAEKMPFMLNDEELDRYRDRLKRENTFRNEMANRRELKRRSQGDQFVKKLVQDVASNTVKTVTSKATNKLMDNLLKTSDERYKEQLEQEQKELSVQIAQKAASEAAVRTRLNSDIDRLNEYEETEKDNTRRINDNVEKINRLMRNQNPLNQLRIRDIQAQNANLVEENRELRRKQNRKRDDIKRQRNYINEWLIDPGKDKKNQQQNQQQQPSQNDDDDDES